MPKSWGTELFRRFEALYRAKFTDNFATEDDVAEWVSIWTRALAGVTGEQIKLGLDRCAREREWPPIEPAGFLKLLEPRTDELGIPSAEEAFAIACKSGRPAGRAINDSSTWAERWQHPIVLAAVRDKRIDLHNLAQLRQVEALCHWRPVYGEYVKRLAQGEEFAFPAERQLEDKTGKAVTPEERKAARQRGFAHLRALRRMVGRSKRLTPWQELHGMTVRV